MTRSDTLQEETIEEMYYYECPSIKYSRTSCFSSEDEDFDNAIRSCKENESNLNNKGIKSYRFLHLEFIFYFTYFIVYE